MLGKCWTVGDLSTVWCWFWCSPAVIHLNLFHMQSIIFINVHYMFLDYAWIEDVFKSLHLKRNMKWDFNTAEQVLTVFCHSISDSSFSVIW